MGFPLGEGQHYNKAASPSFQRDRCAIHPFQMTLAAYQCTGNGGQYWSRLLEHLPKWGEAAKERSMADFSCLWEPHRQIVASESPINQFSQ